MSYPWNLASVAPFVSSLTPRKLAYGSNAMFAGVFQLRELRLSDPDGFRERAVDRASNVDVERLLFAFVGA
jgi:hypothetical protein